MSRIADLAVVDDFTIDVLWAEGARQGRRDRVDLSPILHVEKIFRALRRDAWLFGTARLADDGRLIIWDARDLDLGAEAVERLAAESMTPQDFSLFLKRNNLTQEAAAAVLGRSRRQIGYYLSPGPVPRIVALACQGYEALRRRG